MLKPKTNLRAKLIKVFLIQIALISIVTIAGIYAAKTTVEDILVREALEGEARHFWSVREQHPDFPLPNTLNLKAYLATDNQTHHLPESLQLLEPGLQRATLNGENPIVYVEDNGSDRLYLIFDEVKVSRLALVFGILPLAAVLVVLYLLAWFAYRQSHKAVSPIVKLAKAVEDAEVREGNLPDLDLTELREIPDEEVTSLVKALDLFTQRLELFVERERLFTRDASHELRTPIAVLRSAMELLERRYDVGEDKTISRIYRTLYDMEALIETLLILAREQEQALPTSQVLVNELVTNEIDTLQLLFKDKSLLVQAEETAELKLNAPERVVHILVGNLIRNAFNYTPKGTITVKIWEQGFSVKDSGVGMDEEQVKQVFKPFYRGEKQDKSSGYGLGMTIVKRLCNRYNWHLSIASELGTGTEVSVHFPKSQISKN
ncbi:sensor histidine kinase [Methylophaga sp.]|uniref:sensor histidine kinase n=1 Tax=Methylophaga sp. TaxID=2024840 RepID=UPI003F6A410C